MENNKFFMCHFCGEQLIPMRIESNEQGVCVLGYKCGCIHDSRPPGCPEYVVRVSDIKR